MAIVVSDTSPIRALAHLSLLNLLHDMFGVVLVPPRVADELEHPRAGFAPVPISTRQQFKVVAPASRADVVILMEDLDQGEAEAITLASELGSSLLLIDEMAGRRIAKQRGIQVTGLVGVLLQAKREKRIAQIKEHLETLENELKFFISPTLKAESLRLARE